MDKMNKLGETLRTLMEGEFSGYIRINFSQGSLGRIEKSEEFDASNMIEAQASKTVREEKEIHYELR